MITVKWIFMVVTCLSFVMIVMNTEIWEFRWMAIGLWAYVGMETFPNTNNGEKIK